jgi:maleylpyruvate isomerase
MTPAAQDLVLTEVGSASQQIRGLVRDASEEQLRTNSPLPDWSRAHVVAHICGFSRGMARQWEYALRGELIEQYTGGAEGRNAEIEALAALPVDRLKTATEEALDRLASVVDAMSEQDWELPISYRQGTAFGGLEAAWREYAIHLTDLDLGPTCSAWTAAFCDHLFDFLAPRIPDEMTLTLEGGTTIGVGATDIRVAGTVQDAAAWLAGREPVGPFTFSTGQAPELQPWPARRN